MRIIGAFFVLSAIMSVPAAAQDAGEKPFAGASVTAITGIDDSVTLGKHQTGPLYGGQLGYDWQSNKVVFGVEGEVSGASTKNCHSYTAAPGGPASRLCIKEGRDLYAGVKVGTVLGDTTLLYAKGGYTNARQSFDTTPATAFGSGSGVSDGFRVGAGVEKAIGRNLSVKTEYRYSDYEGGYSRHQGVVGLGVRF